MQVFHHRVQVETLELFRVIELLAHGIGERGVLVQNLQIQLIRPPLCIRLEFASAMSYRALGFV